MEQKILFSILLLMLHCVSGHESHHYQLCDRNNTKLTQSCTTQILGNENADLDSCKVEYISPNSSVCTESFGPIISNDYMGGVSLRPYILKVEHRNETLSYSVNYTVLNITFTNIKWKTMKFRFKKYKTVESHCRNIAISHNVKIDDQSVLYYDCYWSDGKYSARGHILDFEATDDVVVNRGRYFFNVPSTMTLSPTVTEKEWKPFVYIEIMSTKMRLHIVPPPKQLKITAYKVLVKRKANESSHEDEIQKNMTIKLNSTEQEATMEYSLLNDPGLYYFVVMPIHDGCDIESNTCQTVESSRIEISNEVHHSLNVCIASITALVVATLFIYYIIHMLIRRHWCKEYSLAIGNEIPPPTKVLVIYPSANRLHAECVASFVSYLRSEYCFDVMYDGDISATSHGDPYIWAEEALRLASHVVYVVGPAEETNLYNSIYDKPIITAHKDVDLLLLSLLKATRVSRTPKEVMNVFFEHSNGQLPIETRHDKVYFLLKDWHKLISHLSRYLLPKKQIMRTEKGKSFLDDLTRAKKLLGDKKDDVMIRCEKMGSIEKKVLL